MKKTWIDYLPDDVHCRLANCSTIKSDVQALVSARWLGYKDLGKDKQGWTKEDALIAVLELLDCNSVYIDLTKDEYKELIA